MGSPVVVDYPKESSNLTSASIKRAKEDFINVDDVRIVIICSEKIRKLNLECNIYARAFEDHVQEYLKQHFYTHFHFINLLVKKLNNN